MNEERYPRLRKGNLIGGGGFLKHYKVVLN